MNATDAFPSLGLVEFDSIAIGVVAGDAMVKSAPVDAVYAGTVQPGRFLVLTIGSTASVEIAVERAVTVGSQSLLDHMFLADIHYNVVQALVGDLEVGNGSAIGVLETGTVASVLRAADAGRKCAAVTLDALKLADGIGGKGIALFNGEVGDVEVALERAAEVARTSTDLVHTSVVPQIHADMRVNLRADLAFRGQLQRISVGNRTGNH